MNRTSLGKVLFPTQISHVLEFFFYAVVNQFLNITPYQHSAFGYCVLVPTIAPPGLAAEDWGTTHSIVVKWLPLPPSNEFGVLSGYRVRYRLTKTGDEITTGKPVKEFSVDSNTNKVLLEKLEMYGTYSIWVSAFTLNGNGPESMTYGG